MKSLEKILQEKLSPWSWTFLQRVKLDQRGRSAKKKKKALSKILNFVNNYV